MTETHDAPDADSTAGIVGHAGSIKAGQLPSNYDDDRWPLRDPRRHTMSTVRVYGPSDVPDGRYTLFGNNTLEMQGTSLTNYTIPRVTYDTLKDAVKRRGNGDAFRATDVRRALQITGHTDDSESGKGERRRVRRIVIVDGEKVRRFK